VEALVVGPIATTTLLSFVMVVLMVAVVDNAEVREQRRYAC
jgi:hypothetical protein